MKTMITKEIELTRHNATPAAFLSYVRSQLRKNGIADISTGAVDLEYFRSGNDMNFEYRDIPGRPCKAEKSVSSPYKHQTFVLNWDDTRYNEICEFDFDDEKTGTGYYYLINTYYEQA